MSLTNDLYIVLKRFDDLRRAERETFLKKVDGLSRYRNSEGYREEIEAAFSKRKAATDAAKEKAAAEINEILNKMRENCQKIGFKAPSSESVAILQLLSMRKTVTREELDRAARCMEGNRLCLRSLNEIADRHFHVGSPKGQTHPDYEGMATDISPEKADALVIDVSKAIRDILKSPVKKSVLQGAIYNKNQHGIDYQEDDLPQREPLDYGEFYKSVVPENMLPAFERAVNEGRC